MSNLTGLMKKQKAAEKASKFIRGADPRPDRAEGRGKRLSVDIPEEMHIKLKAMAAMKQCSVRDLVLEALGDLFNK